MRDSEWQTFIRDETMPKAAFRFYEELNNYLPKDKRKTDFEVAFIGERSIKDFIEALDVPHTEIDLVLVNQKSVDFNYIVQDGDRISAYPVFESLNIENVTNLRKKPLRQIRFIADVDLGDIAEYMRLLGLDVYFDPVLSSNEIIEISKKEKRIILTKNRNLLKFEGVTHGIFVRPGTIKQQIRDIMELVDIKTRK